MHFTTTFFGFASQKALETNRTSRLFVHRGVAVACGHLFAALCLYVNFVVVDDVVGGYLLIGVVFAVVFTVIFAGGCV